MGYSKEQLRVKIMRIDFLQNATNVYRTEQYIVKQRLSICASSTNDNVVMSTDTYYLRTPERDEQYEFCMASRKYINGKRMKSAMFTRRYVD